MIGNGINEDAQKTLSYGGNVHKDPDKLPEEGLSRPLFKKKKHPFVSSILILLSLIVAVAAFILDEAELHQFVETLISWISQNISLIDNL
jgi:hypothetical protein